MNDPVQDSRMPILEHLRELRTRLITVLERGEEDEWRIVAAQNTAILPIAAPSGG